MKVYLKRICCVERSRRRRTTQQIRRSSHYRQIVGKNRIRTSVFKTAFSFQVSLLILTFLLPLKGCCNNEYSRFLEAYPTASFYPWFCDNIFQSLHILLLFVALDGYVDGENDQPNFSSSYRHILLSNHI